MGIYIYICTVVSNVVPTNSPAQFNGNKSTVQYSTIQLLLLLLLIHTFSVLSLQLKKLR